MANGVLIAVLMMVFLAGVGGGIYYLFFYNKTCKPVTGVEKFSTDGKCTASDCIDGYSLDSSAGKCSACSPSVPGADYDQNKCTFSKCHKDWTYSAGTGSAAGTCTCDTKTYTQSGTSCKKK